MPKRPAEAFLLDPELEAIEEGLQRGKSPAIGDVRRMAQELRRSWRRIWRLEEEIADGGDRWTDEEDL